MLAVVDFWYNQIVEFKTYLIRGNGEVVMGRSGPYSCKDCGCDFDGYIVWDSLWTAAGLKYDDNCCRPCLAKRLGRPLTNSDYDFVPLNFMTVEGFDTENNYRQLYAKEGLDYDKEKAEYMERCARLGLEPKWTLSPSPASRGPFSAPQGRAFPPR